MLLSLQSFNKLHMSEMPQTGLQQTATALEAYDHCMAVMPCNLSTEKNLVAV